MRRGRYDTVSRLAAVLFAGGLQLHGLPAQAQTARPDDVATIDGIIRAYYEVVSGPAGSVPDAERDRSLHHPDAWVAIAGRTADRDPTVRVMTLDDYHADNSPREAGFFEWETDRTVTRSGNMVHVWSSYASARTPDGEPFARGVNSITLFHDGARWWIMGWMFDATAGSSSAPPGVASPASIGGSCEGPGIDPWVTGLRDRVLASDGLAAFAVNRYGAPVACDGTVTSEFDGANFGTVVLRFTGGISFSVETMPPATSITQLRADDGFADPTEMRRRLAEYAEGRGLDIDWSDPEESVTDGNQLRIFRDPDPGLNGSVALEYDAGRLVAIRLSLAL